MTASLANGVITHGQVLRIWHSLGIAEIEGEQQAATNQSGSATGGSLPVSVSLSSGGLSPVSVPVELVYAVSKTPLSGFLQATVSSNKY